MKFGLHVGWAIEGNVGSKHKMDATYLSPHVNIAARTASLAKQYGASVSNSLVLYPLPPTPSSFTLPNTYKTTNHRFCVRISFIRVFQAIIEVYYDVLTRSLLREPLPL